VTRLSPARARFRPAAHAEPERSGQRLTDMNRIPAAVAAMALIAGLGACGSDPGHAAARGTITGLATACAGPPRAGPRPVTVFAWRGNRIVTTQVVHVKAGGGHYRFSLPPGRYLIGAPRSGAESRLVVLHPRQTVTVNFPNQCY